MDAEERKRCEVDRNVIDVEMSISHEMRRDRQQNAMVDVLDKLDVFDEKRTVKTMQI